MFNSGKPAFGNIYSTNDAGDYIKNKKAKLFYKTNYNGYHYSGVLGSQRNYLLFQKAENIKNETCGPCSTINDTELVSGLYSKEVLASVNVVTDYSYNDISCNAVDSQVIDMSGVTVPFYYKYKIDPCGSLFGNTTCGYQNYEKYRVVSKPVLTTASSLCGCVPTCLHGNGNGNGNGNGKPFTVTGDKYTLYENNGYYAVMFNYISTGSNTSSSGTITFNGSKLATMIIVAGGGAGGLGVGYGGGGGGGGGIIHNTSSLMFGKYNITVGSGGIALADEYYSAPSSPGNLSNVISLVQNANFNCTGGGGGYGGDSDKIYGGNGGSSNVESGGGGGGGAGGTLTNNPVGSGGSNNNSSNNGETGSGYSSDNNDGGDSYYSHNNIKIYLPFISKTYSLNVGGGGASGSDTQNGGIAGNGNGGNGSNSTNIYGESANSSIDSGFGGGGGGGGGGSSELGQGGNGGDGVVIIYCKL